MFFRTIEAGMFNTGTEAVEHAHVAAVRQLDDVVGRAEIVVGGIGGIHLHQGEDKVGVDHTLTGVPQRPVVSTGSPEVHLLELFREVDQTVAGKTGTAVAAVLGVSQFAGDFVVVHFHCGVQVCHDSSPWFCCNGCIFSNIIPKSSCKERI